ncbi:MAG: phosphoserine phosphatase SerB [Burkholderiales bacterium]|jgi:phosphoserine phosphatase|nr:phosphoserine phosphatase SerB [Burkholderiales bacterium]
MNTHTLKTFDDIDLLIQAPTQLPVRLDDWQAIAQADQCLKILSVPSVYRFVRPRTPEAAMPLLSDAGFDCALVPRHRYIQEVGVLAMDMDSTLITIECIDEIAGMIGIKDKIAAITERSMRGELDFKESLIERVALLKGTPASALEAVYTTRLNLSPGAEAMLARFQSVGAKTLLISGGFTFFTERLQKRLNLTHVVANELEIVNGQLTGRVLGDIVDAQRKADELCRMQNRYLSSTQPLSVAVGDGANDLPMLARADVSFAYHAKPKVRDKATHTINHCGLEAMARCFNERQ